MIYVYAIADQPERPLPQQLGLRDAGLDKIVWRDIAAVVSTFDGAPLSKTADEVWRHEEVVEGLMGDRAVLPVRFGTMLPSRRHVGDILCRSYGPLARDIERLRGHVEIGMRFLSTTENSAAPNPPLTALNGFAPRGAGSGTAYLRAKVAREQELRDRQRAELRRVQDVYDLLASHANASRLDGGREDRHGIAAAFLVPHDRIRSFRDLVGEVAAANPELALLCTGPWPPYSFVTAGEGAGNWSEACHAS